MTYVTEKAHALRPITTFRNVPADGCDMYLRRLAAFGFLLPKDSHAPLAVDVLDADGDLLDTFPISRRGFEYLRRQLRFKREREA